MHRAVLVAAGLGLALASARAAAADCEPKGKPSFVREVLPISVVPDAPPSDRLSIYPSGAWLAEVHGREPTRGCATPALRRALAREVGRARFRFVRGPVATCAALPTSRTRFAAPRRGKDITTEQPCGVPLDASTTRLVTCAALVLAPTPPSPAEVRARCGGR